MKKILISTSLAIVVLSVLLTSSVFAENENKSIKTKIGFNASTTASTTATTTIKRASNLDKITNNLQTRADKEIDRRIAALNKLQEKIQGVKKISAALKSSLATTIQAQINLLNNLKVKINADTDVATLKSDVQSITRAYRIYALILPQIEIIAAAEKLASTTDSVSAFADKLQVRITAAQTGGKDVTALQALLTDMRAKIADAKVQSAKAIAGVTALVPDNGDKTVMATNTAALKAARTAINTGTKDLKDANKDAVKIRVGLKDYEKVNNATTTATSTATTTSKANRDRQED